MKTTTVLIRVVVLALFAMPLAARAQVSDPRVAALEEQVRLLTGQLEELNFQLLQMQETLRKQQEDNEYRLQQLEENRQGSLTPAETPQDGTEQTDVAQTPEAAPAASSVSEGPGVVATAPDTAPRIGEAPRNLGTLKLDANGNPVEATVDFSQNTIAKAIDGDVVASVSGEMNPEELYRTGYEHILQGDYPFAEKVFGSFVDVYPDDPLAADAHFWLGESLYAQGRLEDAADAFITTRTLYPQATKAPETMLKLGTILAQLGNREVACVTFADAINSHGDMNATIRSRIDAEIAKAKC